MPTYAKPAVKWLKVTRKSKWSLPSSPFNSLEIIKSTSRSVGDAMRDLDSRHLITGDFIVMSADVVSNLPLEGALAEHRARRVADKNAIMTMMLRETDSTPHARSRRSAPSFVIDPIKDRCLHYLETQQYTDRVEVDPDLTLSHPGAEIRNDLIDCYIDICTPDVLALWTDSFDYESPRKHFLYGVLKDYELNGKTIHTHIINDHYARRVRNLQSYQRVSQDIVQRWAYPLCPDSNLLVGQSYRHGRDNVYKEKNVILARSCVIKSETVIGDGTSIADGSTIGKSIIGRRCQIGKNVWIDGSHIWDDTIIGDGTRVRDAIIASEVIVGQSCNISSGALVSYGVRLADGTSVSGSSRITRAKRKRDDDEESKMVPSDIAVVGKGGEGYEFEELDAEDEPKAIASPSRRVYPLWSNLVLKFTDTQQCTTYQTWASLLPLFPQFQPSPLMCR
jgi:translation initiation factor eIF-2B subunit epsilon